MRTTVTLDPEAEQIIRQRMRERGLSFEEALNDAIRSSTRGETEPFRTEVASLGRPAVSLDRTLQVIAELEDVELLRKTRAGS